MEEIDSVFDSAGPAKSLGAPPKIDLYNFEDSEFEDSKYVLTSPRSLEACSKNGVKPVDLLYKPLSDFQEELLPQDVPLRTIYNIYDEHERARQRKLKKCRDDRNKIKSAPVGPRSRTRPVSAAGRINRTRKTETCSAFNRVRRSQSDEDIDKTMASLQRKRTAWVSSIGHKRVTKRELDNRNTKRSGSLNRSRSACSLSMSCSSLLNKNSIRDAKPIENDKLRKTLSKSQDLSSLAVTSRDQKILELMMSKGEEEKLSNRERFLADLAWNQQREREEEMKIQAEMKRRQLLAEENRIKDMKREQKEKRRQKQEEKFIEAKERKLHESMKQWEQSSQSQLRLRDLQLSQRREKEQLKKRLQENNKRVLDKDEEEMVEMMKMKQDHDLKSASQKKESRLLQETMRKLLDNRNQMNSFEQRQRNLQQMHRDEENNLAASIDQKHINASKNYNAVLQRKDKQLSLNRLEREKRLLQAKVSQTKQEEEMEEWRDSIKDHRKMAEQHAAEVVANSKQKTSQKIHDDFVNKENTIRQNQKRLQKAEKIRKHNVESEIALKDMKTKSLELDKSTTINKLRQVAHQSQQLRNELRERYGAESFDKKAFRAELYNKLGLAQCKVVHRPSTAKS